MKREESGTLVLKCAFVTGSWPLSFESWRSNSRPVRSWFALVCRERAQRFAKGLLLATNVASAARVIISALLFALFLTLTGAHDTDVAAWPSRLFYWSLMTAISAVLLVGAHASLSRYNPMTAPWKVRATGVVLLWAPLTAMAMLLCDLLFGGFLSVARFTTLLRPMAAILPALQLILSLPSSGMQLRLNESTSDAPCDGKNLLARLPLPVCDGDLLAVEAHDHYVRVHTSRGSTLLRMRFSDTLSLLASTPGLRVHRSWWIKRDAVRRVRKRRKGAIVTLINGQEVPASQAATRGLLAVLG